ncbi:OVARIAN TUMOR DOMAIN-containing deubiquitinating enzyme 4-like isoform X1 [Apium graveolens]|uniref:OVARIAN TUMOR DOMAIN-containing deubiquitinating enzyme 4-like isoform X1 n=1 Tax=Apium graveolens TaxID=4045 RepID=UPI003D7BD23D
MSSWRLGARCRASAGASCFSILSKNFKPRYLDMSRANRFLPVAGLEMFQKRSFRPSFSKQRMNMNTSTGKIIINSTCPLKTHLHRSLCCEYTSMRNLVPRQRLTPQSTCNVWSSSWMQGSVPASLIVGLLVYSTSEPVNAEGLHAKKNADGECGSPSVSHSHGKQVYTDYSIIGIPGDGRCMFRSVAHGACVRLGKPAPSERLQKDLADELRTSVANEFIKRREETEWFIEGDFDTYVFNIRKPHVWGGEPELLMASHVLQMPITVFMHDKDSGGLITIAEYGQEYGKENPINVLYHGFGHYDALQFPGKSGARSKL